MCSLGTMGYKKVPNNSCSKTLLSSWTNKTNKQESISTQYKSK